MENQSIDISGVTTGSVNVNTPTAETPIVFVRLSKADVSKSGGEDVLVLGRKDKLEFNADSTAMASLMGTLVFPNPTREEALLAYDLFPEHLRFDELVTLYAQHKGIPSGDMALEEVGTIAGEIVLDTMTQLRNGSSLDHALTSQTVHQDYSHLGFNAFRIKQSDDPRVITFTADGMLPYGLFAFDSQRFKRID